MRVYRLKMEEAQKKNSTQPETHPQGFCLAASYTYNYFLKNDSFRNVLWFQLFTSVLPLQGGCGAGRGLQYRRGHSASSGSSPRWQAVGEPSRNNGADPSGVCVCCFVSRMFVHQLGCFQVQVVTPDQEKGGQRGLPFLNLTRPGTSCG